MNDAPTTTGQATLDRRTLLAVVGAVMLPMLMAALDQSILVTATPAIAHDFGDLRDTAWISIAYLMAVTVMIPLYGRLGDRHGRRRVLRVALAVFGVGSLACAAAPNMAALIAARTLQGLGGGGLMVMSQALVGEVVAPIERPRIQTYLASVFMVSSVGGPLLGGFVVVHADWRWLFIGNLPLIAVAITRLNRMPPARQFVASDATAARSRALDWIGAALFAVATSATLAWVNLGGHRWPWASPVSAALIAFAIVVWFVLIRRERAAAAPFLPLELLRRAAIRATAATVVCMAGALFGLTYLLPLYLQLGRGVDASQSGALLLPLTVGILIGAIASGRWVARSQLAGRLPRFGLALAAVALALMALFEPDLHGTALLCAVAGMGLGTVMPNAQIVLQLVAGRANLGIAAATVSLSRAVGATLGTAIFSALFFTLLYRHSANTLGTPDVPSPGQVLDAARFGFGSIACWLALGAAVATRVPPVSLQASADIPAEHFEA